MFNPVGPILTQINIPPLCFIMLLNDQLINTYPLEKIRILLDDKLRFWNVYDVLRIPEEKTMTTFRKATLKKW